MRVYRIYLIRHGMTTANIEGKYVGVTDVPLCEEGIIQLENLKEEFDYPNVGKVYSSPLQRCIQTAQTIYDDITPNIVEDLKEFNFGKYEGASAKDVADDKEFIAWLNSGFTTKMEGAEDGKEFLDRIVNGLNQIILDMMKNQISDVAIFTHGGVISTLLAYCGLPRKKSLEWMVENGKGYTLMINSSLWGNNRAFEVYSAVPYEKDMTVEYMDD